MAHEEDEIDDRLDALVEMRLLKPRGEVADTLRNTSASDLSMLLIEAIDRCASDAIRRSALVKAHEALGRALHNGDEDEVAELARCLEEIPRELLRG